MSEYYNIHTHNVGEAHSIFNVMVNDSQCAVPSAGLFSAGIHPYDYKGFTSDWTTRLTEIARNERCVAIGECGIDKRYDDIERQTEIFAIQCAIAKKLHKPIIIHCVKAQSEILKILKDFECPIIFHSYAKKIERKNIFYSLSLSNIANSDNLSLEKILLETDDSDQKIEENYEALALRRKIEVTDLKIIIEKTFYTIFKR